MKYFAHPLKLFVSFFHQRYKHKKNQVLFYKTFHIRILQILKTLKETQLIPLCKSVSNKKIYIGKYAVN